MKKNIELAVDYVVNHANFGINKTGNLAKGVQVFLDNTRCTLRLGEVIYLQVVKVAKEGDPAFLEAEFDYSTLKWNYQGVDNLTAQRLLNSEKINRLIFAWANACAYYYQDLLFSLCSDAKDNVYENELIHEYYGKHASNYAENLLKEQKGLNG